MDLALEAARSCRLVTSPNPWVGCVIHSSEGLFMGATSPPGGNHAEINALEAAGEQARGADLYTTLEPCDHHGRTGPCTESIAAAGIARVFVAVEDPDPRGVGPGNRGPARSRNRGGDGIEGPPRRPSCSPPTSSTGEPGFPGWCSSWLPPWTGALPPPMPPASGSPAPRPRSDAHRLRAESDAVLVGAGTVRADDPALTVRYWQPPSGVTPPHRPATASGAGHCPA